MVLIINGTITSAFFITSENDRSSQWNLVNTVSVTKGHHQLKFGFDYRRVSSLLAEYNPLVFAEFTNAWQIQNNLADNFEIIAYQPGEPLFKQYALFAQDEWRVAPRLSLSMGLRWDLDGPPTSANGQDAFALTGSLSDPSSLGIAPRGTALWKTPYFNFALRLGPHIRFIPIRDGRPFCTPVEVSSLIRTITLPPTPIKASGSMGLRCVHRSDADIQLPKWRSMPPPHPQGRLIPARPSMTSHSPATAVYAVMERQHATGVWHSLSSSTFGQATATLNNSLGTMSNLYEQGGSLHAVRAEINLLIRSATPGPTPSKGGVPGKFCISVAQRWLVCAAQAHAPEPRMEL